MLECHVLECENLAEDSRGFCLQHIRRYISGQVYENEAGELVDHCLQDHELVTANIRWEASGKNGKKRRRCRECLRDKARRQAKNQLIEPDFPKPYRPQDLTLTTAIADFEKALEVVPAKCKDNPGPWMDYEEMPSQAEADKLCSGCPLVMACKNYAIAARMTDGIWGGDRYENGAKL